MQRQTLMVCSTSHEVYAAARQASYLDYAREAKVYNRIRGTQETARSLRTKDIQRIKNFEQIIDTIDRHNLNRSLRPFYDYENRLQNPGNVSEEVRQQQKTDYDVDITVLENALDSDPTAVSSTIAAILRVGENSEQAQAAANALTEIFGDYVIGAIESIWNGGRNSGTNIDSLRLAIQYAALANGECRRVVNSEYFQNAEPEKQVALLTNAVRADASNQAVTDAVADAVHEFKVSEVEKELMADKETTARIDQTKAKVVASIAERNRATDNLQKQQDVEAQKAEAVRQANEDLQKDPSKENANAVARATNEQTSAAEVTHEWEQAVEKAEQKEQQAKEEADRVNKETMTEIRQKAEAIVNERDAQKAEQLAQRKKMAEEAEARREEERRQKIIEDQRSGKTMEEANRAKLKRWAAEHGLTGEEAEHRVNELMEFIRKKEMGKIDMSKQFSKSEGLLMMGELSRRFNVNVVFGKMADGDHGKYDNDTNTITLNENLTAGQIMVEFALHELTHSLEQSGSYQKYHDTVLGAMYQSDAELNDAIAKKMADYEESGHPIDDIQAKKELVAEFTRTKLNNKDVVGRMVDAGLGGRMRNFLHNINQFLKNAKLTGREKIDAENLRRAERLFQKAINERAKAHGAVTSENITTGQQGRNGEIYASENSAGEEYAVNSGIEALTDAQKQQVLEEANIDYQSALDRGDMEAAQQDVDFAAEQAFTNSKARTEDGKLMPLFHGTSADFNVFDTSISGGKNGTQEGYGIYLTDNPEIPKQYGGRTISAYVNMERPAYADRKTIKRSELAKVIKATCEKEAQSFVDEGSYDNVQDAIRDTWISNYIYTPEYKSINDAYNAVANLILDQNDNDSDIVGELLIGQGIRDYNRAMDFYHNVLTPLTGIDGIWAKWTNQDTGEVSNVLLAFDSSQIKSNEAVTYDDQGNVIPLDQRFSDNPDIRYAAGDMELTDAQKAEVLKSIGADSSIPFASLGEVLWW